MVVHSIKYVFATLNQQIRDKFHLSFLNQKISVIVLSVFAAFAMLYCATFSMRRRKANIIVDRMNPKSNSLLNKKEVKAVHSFLPAFGKVRAGTGEGTVPNLMGMRDLGGITVTDTNKLVTMAFTCCFHTTESIEEIEQVIQRICEQNDPIYGLFSNSTKKIYCESNHRLQNNLIRLHDALPGHDEAKAVKIYWNEQVEKALIPHFLKNEKIDLNDLAFILTDGEECDSPFQAEAMDFENQLQFVMRDREKILEHMITEIKQFCLNILKDAKSVDKLWEEIKFQQEPSSLFLKAAEFTHVFKQSRFIQAFDNTLLEALMKKSKEEQMLDLEHLLLQNAMCQIIEYQ